MRVDLINDTTKYGALIFKADTRKAQGYDTSVCSVLAEAARCIFLLCVPLGCVKLPQVLTVVKGSEEDSRRKSMD